MFEDYYTNPFGFVTSNLFCCKKIDLLSYLSIFNSEN